MHTSLPPIIGRSENTFHVLHPPQHRTPGPTPRTRAPLPPRSQPKQATVQSQRRLRCHEFPPFFPVARPMSSVSDATPRLQSICRNRGLIGESGRNAAKKFPFFNSVRSLLTVPVPKLRLELDRDESLLFVRVPMMLPVYLCRLSPSSSHFSLSPITSLLRSNLSASVSVEVGSNCGNVLQIFLEILSNVWKPAHPWFLVGMAAHARDDSKTKWPQRSRDASVRASTQKKTLRASMRKQCASGLRAPQALENGALRHTQLHGQVKVFHELNASSVVLLQSVFV